MPTSGYRTQVNTFQILAGATESDMLHIGAAKFVSIYAPTVTSCQLFIKAAPTMTGSFYRVQNNALNGDLIMEMGTGLKVFHLPERITAVDHLKFECGVTQTNTVIFSYIVGW